VELLAGKVVPATVALVAQQVVILAFGAVLGLRTSHLDLVAVALASWTLTLLGIGTLLGMLARSLGELSAGYDIGGMLLSSLGGALVPLSAMPQWVRDIAPASPGYWGVSALRAALTGDAGRTFECAGILVLIAMGVGCLAALRFKRGWGRSTTL
jgi:ABC-2 type transport system permease protein